MALLKEEVLEALEKNHDLDSLFEIQTTFENQDEKVYGEETYFGENLQSEALYTSYQDYLSLFEFCQSNNIKSVADLGAGIGRGTLLCEFLELPLKCDSYEIVKERLEQGIEAAKKNDLSTKHFHHVDLLNSSLPKADLYFLYLPVGELLDQLIELMEKSILGGQSFYLAAIESHGNFLSFLSSEVSWLKSVKAIPLFSKRYSKEMMIYKVLINAQTVIKKENLSLQNMLQKYERGENVYFNEPPSWKMLKHFKKDQDALFHIKEKDGEWLCSALEIHYGAQNKTIESVYPPRILEQSEVVAVEKASGRIQELNNMRVKNLHSTHGHIRKILIKPDQLIEYSNGKRLPF